jgi:SAM-dependent methyltransferase
MTENTEHTLPGVDIAEDLRESLDNLIRQSLSKKYTSFSSQNQIPTGNAYQSVQLRDKVYGGFRTLRSTVLAGLELEGAKVLDLGCNLGELSRLARKEGAALVDGFEYDSFFVQIGQAVNALNGVSRVSFYQRDVTDPSIFIEPYDIIFSFSVFAYTQKVLPQIAQNCRRFFVLETHKVTESWPKEYIDKVTDHFPYYCIVKRTDWGQSLDDGARLLLVYAHEQSEITNFLARRDRDLGHDEDDLRYLNINESDAGFLRKFRAWLAEVPVDNVFALENRVIQELASLGDLTSRPEYKSGASGLIYWLTYLQGFFQYYNKGAIDGSNAYIQYLRQACGDLDIDPFMTALVESNDEELYTRIQRRFDDTRNAITGEVPAPVLIFNAMPENTVLPSTLVDSQTGTRLSYSHQDGYHRYFSCLIGGIDRIPYRMVWHPQGPNFKDLAEKSPGLEEQMFAALVTGLFPNHSAEPETTNQELSNVA